MDHLPKRKLVEARIKFAVHEFKHGSPERGRTVFESLLSAYPKRLDVWNVYIDQETALGAHDAVRRLFDRVTSQKLSTKKARSFFKKLMAFEKKFGDESTQQRAQAAVEAYVKRVD